MLYIICALAGILIGTLINAYAALDTRSSPIHIWYLQFFYKKLTYIAVNLVTAGAVVLVYRFYGISLELGGYVVLSTILIAAGVIDLEKRVIPNSLIIGGMVAGILFVGLHFSLNYAIASMLGLVAAGGIFGLISFLSKGGIGMGDIKLFACIGIFLGLPLVLYSMVMSVILSGLAGIVILIARKGNRKSTIPFAPFIFLGTLLSLL